MDELKINNNSIKEGLEVGIKFFKQKKVINWIIIISFLFLLIGSSWIRLQNLPLLKDSTSGEYIPLALDPFYFLRIAETMLEGELPAYDSMRYPALKVAFSPEILPNVLVIMYKTANMFGDYSMAYIDVISTVIFFGLGLIAFFFLVLVLTNSKGMALASSVFLAVIPPYLYRTTAGFADHEAIGMFAFFLALLCYSLALKYLDIKNKNLTKTILYGLLVAFVSAFAIASWGGVAKFIFMIIPTSFVLFWLIKVQDNESIDKKKLFNFLIFYSTWLLSTMIFTKFYGYGFSSIINTVILGSSSILTGGVLLFLIIDYTLILKEKVIPDKFRKHKVLISFGISFIIGLFFIAFFKGGIFSFFLDIIDKFLNPFGAGRVGTTVAENAQPYLMDWIGQTSKIFFWLFFLGIALVGIEISKGIGRKQNKILFSFLWITMISGILFSRISSSSILNGTNFISKFVYFVSLILFLGYCVRLYFKDRIRIKAEFLIIASWLFFMLIAGRGAVRLFFVITPIFCFSGGYLIFKLKDYAKASKEDILKIVLVIVLILVIIGSIISVFNFTNSILSQAKYTGPSANYQWQQAMSWVRNNTPENSIFVHWWDYGYWVQYLGERPTVTDGGHANKFWDHLIGRYVLTTPKPETALSFMKAHNVSYLLIDPTDMGKYSAYSKIGSDAIGEDRYSMIPVLLSDKRQMQETSSGMILIYNGGFSVDEDIVYETGGQQIFLPANQAFIIGVILEVTKTGNDVELKQPEGVFLHNNQQIRIPLRYAYYNKQIKDFGTGLESTIRVIPKVDQSDQGIQIDNLGTIGYLSQKTSESLFAQLYLLNNTLHRYDSLTLVHETPDSSIDYLNMQGANLGDLVYFNGFRGPIKIWQVDYPENIIAREEFLRTIGEYAEFDNLEFVK